MSLLFLRWRYAIWYSADTDLAAFLLLAPAFVAETNAVVIALVLTPTTWDTSITVSSPIPLHFFMNLISLTHHNRKRKEKGNQKAEKGAVIGSRLTARVVLKRKVTLYR